MKTQRSDRSEQAPKFQFDAHLEKNRRRRSAHTLSPYDCVRRAATLFALAWGASPRLAAASGFEAARAPQPDLLHLPRPGGGAQRYLLQQAAADLPKLPQETFATQPTSSSFELGDYTLASPPANATLYGVTNTPLVEHINAGEGNSLLDSMLASLALSAPNRIKEMIEGPLPGTTGDYYVKLTTNAGSAVAVALDDAFYLQTAQSTSDLQQYGTPATGVNATGSFWYALMAKAWTKLAGSDLHTYLLPDAFYGGLAGAFDLNFTQGYTRLGAAQPIPSARAVAPGDLQVMELPTMRDAELYAALSSIEANLTVGNLLFTNSINYTQSSAYDPFLDDRTLRFASGNVCGLGTFNGRITPNCEVKKTKEIYALDSELGYIVYGGSAANQSIFLRSAYFPSAEEAAELAKIELEPNEVRTLAKVFALPLSLARDLNGTLLLASLGGTSVAPTASPTASAPPPSPPSDQASRVAARANGALLAAAGLAGVYLGQGRLLNR